MEQNLTRSRVHRFSQIARAATGRLRMPGLAGILCCLLLLPAILRAQTFSDSTRISLLTAAPGAELYSKFGHTGIRLLDPLTGQDLTYNFGVFDFDTPNFYLKFLRGKLLYKLGLQRTEDYLRVYHYEERHVLEQVLDLSPPQTRQLIDRLRWNYRPENRYYLYDFFFDNCATRVFDLVTDQLTIDFDTLAPSAGKTYRQLLDEYIGHLPWTDFGIDLILGLPADAPADFRGETFLPDYLAANFGRLQIGQQPLVIENFTAVPYPLPPKEMQTTLTPLLAFSCLLLLVLLLTFRAAPAAKARFDRLFFGLVGLAGVLFVLMWTATDHQATWQNLNLLWANPLFLVLALAPRTRRKWLRPLTVGLLVLQCFTLVGFYWLPQEFNTAILPILAILLLRLSDRLGWTKAGANKVLATPNLS